MIIDENDLLILIIDIQEKLLNAIFNKNEVQKNSEIIAKTAQLLNIPVIITEQYPKGLGETIDILKKDLASAKYYEKVTFSAIDNEQLFFDLQNSNKKQIVLFGIETHICVFQTALALLELGYNVTLIKNASGSRSENEHNSAIEYLNKQGAHIKTTEMVLFELLKTSKHPKFKEIQALIK